MEYRYLVSRLADPVIGISIGLAAYIVHEKRVSRKEGHSLVELIRQRWA